MKVYIKTTADGKILEAPQTYKNISNFNKSKTMMEKHGFVEMIKGYLKSSGELKYIEPEKWEQHKTYYTEQPYPNDSYEWSSDKETWEMKLDKAKEMKLAEIHSAVNTYMDTLKKGFSNAEMETWTRQENGVKLLNADINSTEYDAQWVKALAETRGVTLEEMMQRISYATNLMNTYAYQLVGYQQRLEDLVNAATTVDEVMEISFNIEQS